MKNFVLALSMGLLLALAVFALRDRFQMSDSSSAMAFLDKTDHIVMIVFDTLRADHLPFYGYQKNTAPFLTSLAKESVVFERAISSCSSTAPSMASKFTSLYPSQHGVITGKVATGRLNEDSAKIVLNRIPEQLTTLGEFLSRSGYPAYGVADNLNISEELGFLRGFEEFHTFRYKGANKVNKTVLSMESKLKSPSFVYVHYMDPHLPYHGRKPLFRPGMEYKPEKAYNSEIRYADDRLKILFEHFGWKENALVIFVADHGEEFGDHGLVEHGKTLYPEVIRVPFFIYHRNIAAKVVKETVHTIDIMPTLASILGQPKEDLWEGESLAGYLDSSFPKPPRRTVYSELLRLPEHPKDPKQAVLDSNWLYIRNYDDSGVMTTEEVYDLDSDPTAVKDKSQEDADRLEMLRNKLDEFNDTKNQISRDEVEIELDKESIENLKTLGYVG